MNQRTWSLSAFIYSLLQDWECLTAKLARFLSPLTSESPTSAVTSTQDLTEYADEGQNSYSSC